MLSIQRDDFIELIVPITGTTISTYLFCYSILGIYDEVVISIISCISVDMENHNGKIQYGTPDLNKLMMKVYKCNEKEKNKFGHFKANPKNENDAHKNKKRGAKGHSSLKL